jgi:hypothetical protein
MPNHCFNRLVLSETTLPEILSKYVRKDEYGVLIFDFEKIAPIGDAPDPHDQRIEKWGTKWGGYDLTITESCLEFYTAWTPPIPIIGKLAELHKDLIFTLEYYEAGMMFRGTAVAKWQNDEVVLTADCRAMTKEDLDELGFSDR